MILDPAFAAFLLIAQNFEQRGFFENQALIYPQTAPNDSGRFVDSGLLRWEASYKFRPWFRINSALDARTDTHRQTAREFDITFDDRTIQRPAFALRRFSATLNKGGLTAELGRQFIRWGKTDVLVPTDRFAPRDFLGNVVDAELMGVWATRVTYERRGGTIDLVWQPRFTPSRTPLLNQRWTVIPTEAAGVALFDGGARYPGRSQFGARWNYIGRGYEYSVSYFDGFNHLPSLDARATFVPPSATLTRYYPRLRLYGADAAVPLPWFTLKGEAAYFTFPGVSDVDQYVLYVIQVERQVKEWSFVGGYAGEARTRTGTNPLRFAPDRGFAKSFVGRAGLTIDANRSLSVEAAIRAAGSFVRFEYSQLFGQHWRATGGVAWIRGDMSDFLGQYNRNSYASLALRYSF